MINMVYFSSALNALAQKSQHYHRCYRLLTAWCLPGPARLISKWVICARCPVSQLPCGGSIGRSKRVHRSTAQLWQMTGGASSRRDWRPFCFHAVPGPMLLADREAITDTGGWTGSNPAGQQHDRQMCSRSLAALDVNLHELQNRFFSDQLFVPFGHS